MKHIKPSINVEYFIESYNDNRSFWELEYRFDRIQEAIDEMEKMKTSLPKKKFRLIRSEWQVIGLINTKRRKVSVSKDL
jgi:hypothetical protein